MVNMIRSERRDEKVRVIVPLSLISILFPFPHPSSTHILIPNHHTPLIPTLPRRLLKLLRQQLSLLIEIIPRPHIHQRLEPLPRLPQQLRSIMRLPAFFIVA